MNLRFSPAVLLVALALASAPHAQITLTASDVLNTPGDYDFSNLGTDNEEGADTAAIQALINQSGADQTWDFTAIPLDQTVEGTITVSSGAVGPGATASPLSQATYTVDFPSRR